VPAAVVSAADEATAEALARDAALVSAADEATTNVIAQDAAVVSAAADQAAVEGAAAATAAAPSITTAEARILRYLATRSTLAVVADKLGISRSTAKDRVQRVYKKLGVHNRADAVARARALGVID
jgi:DNA-binding CsgD family transcriptional regulator